MKRVVVAVTPVQGGWSVASSLSACPLMFLSAADAESQALWFAKLADSQGWDAEVQLHHLGGGISVQAYAAHPTAPPMARGAPTPRSPRRRRLSPEQLREAVFTKRPNVWGVSDPL